MNLRQIRSLVSRNTKADTMNMPDGSINLMINLAQKEVVRQTLCLRKTATITTVAAQEQYDLPSDFHKSTKVKVGSNFPTFQTEEYIRGLYTTDAATGTPYYYFIDREAGKYGFYPIPSGVETGIFMYRALPTVLSGDTDTPDIHEAYHDLLVMGASYRVAEQMNNIELHNHYFALFRSMIGDMANDMSSRQADIEPQPIFSKDILDV